MMCDDCIYSKDSTCILENAMFDIDDNCLSKIDKETYAKIYNKAIDDFAKACKEDIMCKTFGLREIDINNIAEMLKAGESE